MPETGMGPGGLPESETKIPKEPTQPTENLNLEDSINPEKIRIESKERLNQDIESLIEQSEKKWPPKLFKWLQRNTSYRIFAGTVVSVTGLAFGWGAPALAIRAGISALGGVVGAAGIKSRKIENAALEKLNQIDPNLFAQQNEPYRDYIQRLRKTSVDEETRSQLLEIYASLTETATARGKEIIQEITKNTQETKEELAESHLFKRFGLEKTRVDEYIDRYNKLSFKAKLIASTVGVMGGALAAGIFAGTSGAALIGGGAALLFSSVSKKPEDSSPNYQYSDKIFRVKTLLEQLNIDEHDIKTIQSIRKNNSTKRWLWALGGGAVVGGVASLLSSKPEQVIEGQAVPSSVDNQIAGSEGPVGDVSEEGVNPFNYDAPKGSEAVGAQATPRPSSENPFIYGTPHGDAQVESTSMQGPDTDNTVVNDVTEKSKNPFIYDAPKGSEAVDAQATPRPSSENPFIYGTPHGDAQVESTSMQGPDTDDTVVNDVTEKSKNPFIYDAPKGSEAVDAQVIPRPSGTNPFIYGEPHKPEVDGADYEGIANKSEAELIGATETKAEETLIGSDSFTAELEKVGEFDDGPLAAERMAAKILGGLEGKGQLSFPDEESRKQFLAGLSEEMKGKYFNPEDGSLMDNGGGYKEMLGDLSPYELAKEVQDKMANGETWDTQNVITPEQLQEIIDAKKAELAAEATEATSALGTVSADSEVPPSPEPTAPTEQEVGQTSTEIAEALHSESGELFYRANEIDQGQLNQILDPNNGYMSKEVSDGLKRLLDRDDVTYKDFRLSEDLSQLKVKLPDGFIDPHERGGFYGVELLKDAQIDTNTPSNKPSLSELLGGKPEDTSEIPVITKEPEQSEIPVIETSPPEGQEIPVTINPPTEQEIPTTDSGKEIPVYNPEENREIPTTEPPAKEIDQYEPTAGSIHERFGGALTSEQVREIDDLVEKRGYTIDMIPDQFKEHHRGIPDNGIVAFYKEMQKMLLAREYLRKG